MSLEAALAAHAEVIAANTAETRRNNDFLERVIAGQAAALEKIETPKAPRTTKKADAPAPASDAPSTAPAAEAPASAPTPEAASSAATEVSDADVRNAAVAWMAKVDPAGEADPSKKDMAKRTECAAFLGDILNWMGFPAGAKITGPDATLSAEQRQQAVFFINRRAAGLTVDFSADYDFDGDPAQGAAAAPAAVVDPLG